MNRRGAESCSRCGGGGATLSLASPAGSGDFWGARSTGVGAISRVGVKSSSCFRERLESPRKSGVRSRNRSHRGGTTGRAGSISVSFLASAGGAAERFACGSDAARSATRSVGAGAINRGGDANSGSESSGGGAMARLAPGSGFMSRSGRRSFTGGTRVRGGGATVSVDAPRWPLTRSGGGGAGRAGSAAGAPLRARSGAAGCPRRLGSGAEGRSGARSCRGGGIRRRGSIAGSFSQEEPCRGGGPETTRLGSTAPGAGGSG